ncbi:universal stress protein [Motiliproteus coralliicola]|uniref:Universal stress protein n=1 Tax=Motiliproteus coralliicola TaxID=2283196 RepID=A0A369WCT6_9GAMM|nr:universal stress protein [Motiliproteus coralliicola]RDE19848.1 universal stress protein [Motiliproteus coralliicola]
MIQPKSLLMPINTSGQVVERIQGALAVASYCGAHLEVLHAQVSPRQFIPEDAMAMRMPHQMVQQLEELADKYARSESDELQQQFAKLCDQQQVLLSAESSPDQASTHWQEVNGLRSELVAENGKVADLILIPRPRSGKPTATFEAAIMRSGKPVLLMPRTQTRFNPKRVLIAWNGSTEGGRAVTHALPWLQRAESVVIATSKNSAQKKPGADELIGYLSRHGIQAEPKQFDSRRRSAGEGLLDLAGELSADLLVMGAFTHRRVHEQIFGGVTRHMVANAQLPVLMMH